jgi:hypothetical protein
VSPFFPFLF